MCTKSLKKQLNKNVKIYVRWMLFSNVLVKKQQQTNKQTKQNKTKQPKIVWQVKKINQSNYFFSCHNRPVKNIILQVGRGNNFCIDA